MTHPAPSGTHAPGPVTAALLGLSRYTPLGRGQMRKLMAKGVRALNPDAPLDVSLYGGHARLHHTGNNSEVKALLSPKCFAREEYAFCAQHMPQTGGVFLDIGANAGVFSLYMASHMQSGTLIAAEPQPAMFTRLTDNFDLNPAYASRLDLHLQRTAIGGSTPGKLSLSVPTSAGQASARSIDGAPTLEVPVIPMLDLLSATSANQLDLLKIDVEGFEDSVLFPFFKDAEPALHPKAIVMECCHAGRWQNDCEALLIQNGYQIVHKDRTNMMLLKG